MTQQNARLVLGLASKGRLKQQTEDLLRQLELELDYGGASRSYRAKIPALPTIEIQLYSAREIVERLIDGSVHCAITGEDLLAEKDGFAAGGIHLLQRLGFGRADLSVAVPQAWIDVDSMADLDEIAWQFRKEHKRRIRVATKYPYLTQKFFTRHAISDYRIVESPSASEGALASGSAEMVVDIVSTGKTLRENHLKILSDGVILRSQAVLAASQRIQWSAEQCEILAYLVDLLGAKLSCAVIKAWHKADFAPGLIADLEGLGAKILSRGEKKLQCYLDRQKLIPVIIRLRELGASPILVSKPDQIFAETNPTLAQFLAAINIIGK